MSATISPINVEILLGGNPSHSPQYSVNVQTGKLGEIAVADPRATRAMVALMDMQAVLGGAASHWGGPSAFAELMSSIYGYAFAEAKVKKNQWYQNFHIINDAGHCENGIYALKANYNQAGLSIDSLQGFRSIQSPLTGHGESHLFPEGVYLSNGPLGSSLGQAQGLAFADQLSGQVQRVTVTAISDGACMEGEAKEALAAIPGLALKGKMAPFILVISDNNTKLSGRIDEHSFSMSPTFESLSALGWKVLSLENGHDIQACMEVFEHAVDLVRGNPQTPVAIHAKTIKGYGVKSTAESSSGGHGFPLSKATDLEAFLGEIYQGKKVPEEFIGWSAKLQLQQENKASGNASGPVTEKVQVGVSAALRRAVENNFPVYSISSDLPGSTGIGDFHKSHPDRFIDIGVAESNMVSMAAGMSKLGYIPVVDTFAQFGVTKGALPLTMAALSQAPIIGIFSHIGFQDAADGASHQSLCYYAMTSAIPHTDIHTLTCSEEAEELVFQAIKGFVDARQNGKVPRSQIFFLGRENFPKRLQESSQYKLGQAQILFDNVSKLTAKNVTIAAVGPLLMQAMKAARLLEDKGIGCIVVNPSCVNRIDQDTFSKCLSKTGGRLITVEEHQNTGGLAGALSQSLAILGKPLHLRMLAVNDTFGQSAYKAIELYQKHHLDGDSIVNAGIELAGL